MTHHDDVPSSSPNRTLLFFTASSIILQFTTMGCGFLVLLWVEPDEIGLWHSLLLIGIYTSFIQAGILNGLNRELPFSMGQGDTAAVLRIAGTAQTVAVLSGAICLLGIPIAVVMTSNLRSSVGVSIVLVAAAATTYRNYLASTYRASSAFDSLSWIQLIEAAAAVATLPFVALYSYYGLAFRFGLLAVAGAGLNYAFRPIRNTKRFHTPTAIRLLRTGLPVFSFGYILEITSTIPRLVLLHFGGVIWVGNYAPAAAMINAMRALPTAVSRYVYPQMSFTYGRRGDPTALWPFAWKSTLFTAAVSSPVFVVTAIVVPRLIAAYLPEYGDAIPAILWTLLAGFFLGNAVAANSLYTLKKWHSVAAYVSIRLLSVLGFCVLFVSLLGTVEGVAIGLALAEAIALLSCFLLVWRATRSPRAVER